MYDQLSDVIKDANSILVIQAANPDGDSLGSALALEEILGEMGKQISLHCSVDIPKYLRYVKGWDRVSDEFNSKCDAAIIVDTVSDTLLSKTLEIHGMRHFLETHPVIVLDHHASVESSLPFEHQLVMDSEAVATGEMVYQMAKSLKWPITPSAAEAMMIAILSDSLGLSTEGTTARSIHVVAELVEHGASPSTIETARRALMKKSPEILTYKGELIKRIEYLNDGQLALVHIPWEEIEKYSDQYNPSVLVLDEMRLVEGVQVAVAIKTYPDGKVTGKLRANVPVCDKIAGFFGGGGHAYAAGFRAYENYETIKNELITVTQKTLQDTEK